MARLRRVPPGRAGRLWLQHRLAVAERGAELLDQKLRILRTEAQRLELVAQGTGRLWAEASNEAARWLVRAALTGGERAVRLASDDVETQVELTWTWTIGVRHPSRATCTPPPPSRDLPAANAAVVAARVAHRRAVEAAAQHAVAQAALRMIEAEEAATRRRLRAIDDRWLPLLGSTLKAAELGLEEQEHADGVRLRWSRAAVAARDQQHGGPGRGATPG